jgi:hypothetical protein
MGAPVKIYKHELAGQTFGRLTVIRLYRRCKIGGVGPVTALWLTTCECTPGREHVVSQKSLLHPTKPARSCGCIQAEARKDVAKRRHGMKNI